MTKIIWHSVPKPMWKCAERWKFIIKVEKYAKSHENGAKAEKVCQKLKIIQESVPKVEKVCEKIRRKCEKVYKKHA